MIASSARAPAAADLLRLLAVALAACLLALAVAIGNTIWFEVVNARLALTAPIPRALLFSSYLVGIGGVFVARDPRAWGFRAGSMRADAAIIAAALAGYALLTWLALILAGSTPYDDASKLVEIVIVPFSEELVFRAVLLTLLVRAVRRAAPGRSPVRWAVAIDAVAFGVAHSANALTAPVSFVAMQVAFAVIVGAGCAALMARTRSVYPAMVLHGVVNAVVVLT